MLMSATEEVIDVVDMYDTVVPVSEGGLTGPGPPCIDEIEALVGAVAGETA